MEQLEPLPPLWAVMAECSDDDVDYCMAFPCLEMYSTHNAMVLPSRGDHLICAQTESPKGSDSHCSRCGELACLEAIHLNVLRSRIRLITI